MQNHLKNQTSPYLLQHADNPVNWYPWCNEAFERAKAEDKPIFLSIGYSTCHWCHVMAHESFEDDRIAEILNRYFISIKVDKEERPDIDSIYMAVCQAFTGSGGWPTTIFLTPDQKPFFAGTYFPKTSSYGRPGLEELLLAVHKKWENNRGTLLESAEEIISFLNGRKVAEGDMVEGKAAAPQYKSASHLIDTAFSLYKRSFDEEYGGFGNAPKFPTPHNLLFLMRYYEKSKDAHALKMVEKTLLQMYRGGMFDHIGGGFSRYSTDRYFLVPHFEKMLYDNALLILAYCKAYQITGNQIYCDIAEKTAEYVLREMTSPEGGFYCAQDADSEGVEGKYYLFEPTEILKVLGDKVGEEFNRYFDITEKGNFEGKNIPNLLQHKATGESATFPRVEAISDVNLFEEHLPTVYEYRKKRYALHLDDKILTSWNGLMIAALCSLYRVTGNESYLNAAKRAKEFIEEKLEVKGTLHVSFREGQCGGKGFLDDYANMIFALLGLYGATLDKAYLERACFFGEKTIRDFCDREQGGFFLYGKDNEQLILRPKETYDGAVFSGNSAMAYNLVQLYYLTDEERYKEMAEQQLSFMSTEAEHYPTGYAMFLVALWDYLDPPDKITIVLKENEDMASPLPLPCRIPLDTIVHILKSPTKEYPLKDDKTTFYVCKGHSCKPPVNDLDGDF
ncbi:MAG: thioredoxin domain-containing protein [Lachnospiraceae bacterium]|nr:thioredoxin domain-containing protein [Lachnospiraceae bacterium]